MNAHAASTPRGEALRLAAACAALLMASGALGAAFNALRPEATRLPWTDDWDRHIETLAFRAGIPVTFLLGARERLGDPATVVFDSREPDVYAHGHLPGALSLPVADIDARIVDHVHRLTPETPILVYCGGADCDDGLELALRLREFGFQDLTLYPGGYAEWVKYGGVVRTGETP